LYKCDDSTLEAALLIVLTFIKYVGCFKDIVCQDRSHLYKPLYILTLLHHVSYVQK